VSPEGGIASRASKRFFSADRDVNFGLVIHIFFSKAQIYQVNIMSSGTNTYQKVIRLNVSMEIAALVYVLETLEYLICDHEDCLK